MLSGDISWTSSWMAKVNMGISQATAISDLGTRFLFLFICLFVFFLFFYLGGGGGGIEKKCN